MDSFNRQIINLNIFLSIKSKLILKLIFNKLQQPKNLNIIKYNKSLQKRLDIGISHYENYCFETKIEISPKDNIPDENTFFIKISPKENEAYYHIYFNDGDIETKKLIFQ